MHFRLGIESIIDRLFTIMPSIKFIGSPGRILGLFPGILGIRPAIRYLARYEVSGQISGIRLIIRYTARYKVFCQISGIQPDKVSGQISGIRQDIRYPARYQLSGEAPRPDIRPPNIKAICYRSNPTSNLILVG